MNTFNTTNVDNTFKKNAANRKKITDSNYKQGYIDWLGGLEWDFFMTGTTRYDLSLKSARRLAERYFKFIKQPGDLMFWVAEKFEVKDGHHIHTLLRHTAEDQAEYVRLINLWQCATGNKALNIDGQGINWDKTKWNRVDLQRYDPKRGAAGYVSKYVFKANADFDILYC